MPIFTGVGSPGTVGPASGGKVTPINNISTAGAQVIGINPSRTNITFINPHASINVFVYPMLQANGQPNTPSIATPGGAMPVFPGVYVTISGECQGAWGAFSAAGTNVPLTIMESNLT